MSARPAAPTRVAGPWRARLELRFEQQGSRTALAHRRHEGPLLVQRPFYPEGVLSGPCHVYVLHPPGGVVSGDELELSVQVAAGAQALVTTAAAAKFYRSADGQRTSHVRQRLEIEHGELEWLPFENIFYPSSIVELATIVQLSSEARFVGWEIGCLGLPARGQHLEAGRVRQRLELWCAGRPLLLERVQLDRACAAASWGLHGNAAFGSWIGYPARAEHLELARALAAPWSDGELLLGCTLVDRVLCCRARAARADRLRAAFIELWRALRPALLGRVALPPRIWAT